MQHKILQAILLSPHGNVGGMTPLAAPSVRGDGELTVPVS